ELFGLSLEQNFSTGTYLGVAGGILNSKVNRDIGVFEANFSGFATLGTTREKLDYEERSIIFTFNQLLGNEWSFGARYRLSDVDLRSDFDEVKSNARLFYGWEPHQHLEGTLHELNFQVNYAHPSGIFAQAQALWYAQNNRGTVVEQPGDEFWQFNLFAGYRF